MSLERVLDANEQYAKKKKNTCYNEQVETEMIKKVLFRIAPQNMKFLILSTFKYVYYPFAESYFESGLKKKNQKKPK